MEIAVETSEDGSRVVLRGDLGVRCTSELRAGIADQLSRHVHVTLDLTDVPSIDLTALKVVAFAARQATREGRCLTVLGCSPAVRRMLHLSHLDRVVLTSSMSD